MNCEHINVLITGGSRGTGAAIAKKCAEYGARVIVHYNSNLKEAEAVAASIGDKCHRAECRRFITTGGGRTLMEKSE